MKRFTFLPTLAPLSPSNTGFRSEVDSLAAQAR